MTGLPPHRPGPRLVVDVRMTLAHPGPPTPKAPAFFPSRLSVEVVDVGANPIDETPPYKPLLAMAPQVAVRIDDAHLRSHARACLEAMHFSGGAPFIRVQETGDSLSIGVHTPPLADMRGDTLVCGERSLDAAEAGVRKREMEPGSAYHVPEGTLAIYAPQAGERIRDRPRVAADRIKDWLLSVSEGGASRVAAIADTDRAAA